MTGLPRPDPGSGPTRALVAVAVLAFLAIHLMLVLADISPVRQGELPDTDAYTWANRAGRLLETGAWFDSTEPRSNAPFGETSHWTRPLDVLTIAIAAPVAPFTGIRAAVFLAAAVLPPLLGLLMCASLVWASASLVPRAALALVALAVFAQPLPMLYAVAGRLDHHLLILSLFGLTFGWLLRAITGGNRAQAVLAGISAGVGLWVSTEFLATLLAVQVGLGMLWLRDGDAAPGRRFAAGLFGSATIAALIERGTTAFTAVEFDRISLPHVALVALVSAFWLVLARIPARTPSRRAASAALAGCAVVLVLVILFPGFERGPFAQVDAGTRSLWLNGVTELHGLFVGSGRAGRLLYFLGPALVALPWSVRMALKDVVERRRAWLLFTLFLAVFCALTVTQVRWSLYVQTLGAVGLAGALHGLLKRLEHATPAGLAAVARVILVTGALTGFALGSWLLDDRRPPTGQATATGTCSVRELADRLPAEPAHVVLALMDFGPELLYRTPHSVIATPYHRNPGIVAAHRILTSTTEEARDEIEARGIDWILLCPGRDEGFFGSADPESLYNRLVGGRVPEGVLSRRLPGDRASGFRLFEIVGDRTSGS